MPGIHTDLGAALPRPPTDVKANAGERMKENKGRQQRKEHREGNTVKTRENSRKM